MTKKTTKEFQLLLTKAGQSVSNYFDELQLHPERGQIKVSAARKIFLPDASMSVDFYSLCRKLFGSGKEAQADRFSSSFLYELAQQIGSSDARVFHEATHLADPFAKMAAGFGHCSYNGWALTEIQPESRPGADQDCLIVYKHSNSFECNAWQQAKQQPHHPACVMNAGFMNGWCQKSFGISLETRELSCKALGHSDCLFVMAPPEHIDSQITNYASTHPDLDISRAIKPAAENYGEKVDEALISAFDLHLLSYPDDMEAMQKSLASNVHLLHKEVEARKLAEQELSKSEERWRELSDVLFDCILICRGEDIIYANPSSTLLFNLPTSSILESSVSDLIGKENWEKVVVKITELDNKPIELELEKGDQIIYIDLQAHNSTDDKQVLAIRDVSDRANAKMRLERLANFDSLTGLPNRIAFERIVSRQISNSSAQDQHALLYLDLDKFKLINDNYGHKAGDLLLYEVAQRTRDGIRAGDILARMGGDEFTLWLPGLQSSGQARMTAERILASLRTPFLINNSTVTITFSIGIAMYPEHGIDLVQLMQHADQAMYQAKAAGRNTFCFFNEP